VEPQAAAASACTLDRKAALSQRVEVAEDAPLADAEYLREVRGCQPRPIPQSAGDKVEPVGARGWIMHKSNMSPDVIFGTITPAYPDRR
jgi:hypothetical protein